MTTTMQPDQIRVTIEVGADAEPGERVAAALAQLAEALREEGDAEVTGYADAEPQDAYMYFQTKGIRPAGTPKTFIFEISGVRSKITQLDAADKQRE